MCIARTRLDLEAAGLLEEWREVPPLLMAHLQRLQDFCQFWFDEEPGFRPVPLVPNLLEGWGDLKFDLVVFEGGDGGALQVDGAGKSVFGEVSRVTDTGQVGRRLFRELGRQQSAIELASPGKSEVVFTTLKPVDSNRARVRLYHEVPSRSFLPLRGLARMEVDLCDGDQTIELELGARLETIDFDIPPLMYERCQGDIQVKIGYLGSDAVYWLWSIVVDFE